MLTVSSCCQTSNIWRQETSPETGQTPGRPPAVSCLQSKTNNPLHLFKRKHFVSVEGILRRGQQKRTTVGWPQVLCHFSFLFFFFVLTPTVLSSIMFRGQWLGCFHCSSKLSLYFNMLHCWGTAIQSIKTLTENTGWEIMSVLGFSLDNMVIYTHSHSVSCREVFAAYCESQLSERLITVLQPNYNKKHVGNKWQNVCTAALTHVWV